LVVDTLRVVDVPPAVIIPLPDEDVKSELSAVPFDVVKLKVTFDVVDALNDTVKDTVCPSVTDLSLMDIDGIEPPPPPPPPDDVGLLPPHPVINRIDSVNIG
jgi:hypothetical protein